MQSRRSFLKKLGVALGVVAVSPLIENVPVKAEDEQLAKAFQRIRPMTMGSASGMIVMEDNKWYFNDAPYA